MIFYQGKVAKEGFYGLKNHWNVNVANIIISKLVKIKNSSEYLIGYLDEDIIGPVVLILHKMSSNAQAFKVKDENKNNKLRSFLIVDDKLLGKYKTI